MDTPIAKLSVRFDPARLEGDLAALCEVSGVPAGYPGEGHRAWRSITLYPRSGTGPDLLERLPYIRHVLEEIGCRTLLVRIMVLEPEGIIREHRDAFLEHSIARLHLPIVTHPLVDFFVGGVKCDWCAGELWYGDFSLPHRAHNRSTQTRIHLVIDVRADERLARLFPDRRLPPGMANPLDTGRPYSPALERFVFRFNLPAGFEIPGTGYESLAAALPGSIELDGDLLTIYVNRQPMLQAVPSADNTLDIIGLPIPARLLCRFDSESGKIVGATLAIGPAEIGIPLELAASQ